MLQESKAWRHRGIRTWAEIARDRAACDLPEHQEGNHAKHTDNGTGLHSVGVGQRLADHADVLCRHNRHHRLVNLQTSNKGVPTWRSAGTPIQRHAPTIRTLTITKTQAKCRTHVIHATVRPKA